MSKATVFIVFFASIFFHAGAYGLTFMLPRLFDGFGANEKDVGAMLMVTTVATLVAVYFSGHLADKFGRVATLGLACFSIAWALFLFGSAHALGVSLVVASCCLGAGWGLTYSLAPVVVTQLVRKDERVRYFALLSVFLMAGFGLAPVMSAVLEEHGFTVSDAFHVTAALCAFSGVLFLSLITPIRRLTAATGQAAASRLTLGSVKAVLNTRALRPIIMVWLGASVFAGMNNFQTVFADIRNLDYADYFLAYTLTVLVCRILLAKFKGGESPYATIAGLQYVMCGSIVLFIVMGGNQSLYILVAILFGIGYGASYPVLAAMAANDAKEGLEPQTLQIFAFAYFVGIFGFPLAAGWIIVEAGVIPLLIIVALLAAVEASMAAMREWSDRAVPALARS